MRFYYILHKNSIGHLLTTSWDYFRPLPKVLEKKWTIYLFYFDVHFRRVLSLSYFYSKMLNAGDKAVYCYIHKNWNYTIKPTLVESPYWEEMFVEISNPDNPKSTFTVGNFYRPPHIAVAQLTSFIDYFAEKLAHFNTREKFYICGDFNINLLSLSSNEHVRNYFEGILSSGFLPTITLPSRLSVNSTLIDNIFLNKQEHLNFAGILDCEISDHQMTLINVNLMPPTEKNKYVTIYSHNDESISKFRNDIIDKRIFNQLNKDLHSNPNANYNLLESEIVHSMNSHLGIKIVKFNKKKNIKGTHGLLMVS